MLQFSQHWGILLCSYFSTTDVDVVPDVLFNLLTWVIADKGSIEFSTKRTANLDDHTERRISSTGNDIVFSAAAYPTKKHTTLAMALHHLFRSKLVVTVLNRLGHCSSYSQVQEIETSLATQHALNANEVSLPQVVDPKRPFHFVWHKNDLCEESLCGKGTTHCTNGIVIQRNAPDDSLINSTPVSAVHSSKRKRSLPTHPMILPVFPSGNKVNPPPMAMPSDFNLAITTQVNGVQPVLIDFLWILARMCPSGDVGHPTAVKEDAQCVVEESQLQVVPAGTAFNSLLCKESTPPRSTVAYCPVISASPTDSATVYALLSQSVSMTRKAELPFCVIVLDQAIYAKATDIVLQRASEFSDVVLRMGGFHICMTLLAIIGKRFSDGGLLNLLVEADVAGFSTAGLALSGKQYNGRCASINWSMKQVVSSASA